MEGRGMTSKSAMPVAWPETVREALRAIQFRASDLDAPYSLRRPKAEARRVRALEAALELSIATHGMHGGPDDEHGCFVLSSETREAAK